MGEHGQVVGRPPHPGARRPRRKTLRSVATQCDQLVESTEQCQLAVTPTTSASVSPSPVTASVNDCLTVNVLNIRDGSRPSSAESSTSPTAALARRSDSDLLTPTSRRRLRHAAPPLDSVDLWEDSGDSELMLAVAASQTCRVDLTTADDNHDDHATKRARERRNWSRNDNQRRYQQTSAADERTGSDAQALSAASTATRRRISRRLIPSIIESGGRPATAHGCAADLSHGSVELHQRRPPTDAGLEMFIRGMQMTLIGNGERTTRSEVKVTQAAERPRLSDSRSSNIITMQSTGFF